MCQLLLMALAPERRTYVGGHVCSLYSSSQHSMLQAALATSPPRKPCPSWLEKAKGGDLSCLSAMSYISWSARGLRLAEMRSILLGDLRQPVSRASSEVSIIDRSPPSSCQTLFLIFLQRQFSESLSSPARPPLFPSSLIIHSHHLT